MKQKMTQKQLEKEVLTFFDTAFKGFAEAVLKLPEDGNEEWEFTLGVYDQLNGWGRFGVQFYGLDGRLIYRYMSQIEVKKEKAEEAGDAMLEDFTRYINTTGAQLLSRLH
jgi:hypothetical protein